MSRIAPGDEIVIHCNVERYQRLSRTDHNEATWRSMQKMLDELEAKVSLADAPQGADFDAYQCESCRDRLVIDCASSFGLADQKMARPSRRRTT